MHDRHERASPLLAAYALGALDTDEAQIVGEHLEEDGCVDCEEEVGALRRVAGALPLGERLLSPSAALKARVLSAAEVTSAAEPAHRRLQRGILSIARGGRWQPLAASVGVLTLGGLLAWSAVLQTRVDDLRTENARLETEATATASLARDSSATLNAALLSLSSEGGRTLAMESTPAAPLARGRLLWDPGAQRYVLLASGLDPTTGPAVYVLWADTGQGPARIGKFYVDQTGTGVTHGYLDVPLDQAGQMVVTLEVDPATESLRAEPVLLLSR